MCGLEARAVDIVSVMVGEMISRSQIDVVWFGTPYISAGTAEPTEPNSVMKFTHIFGPMVLRRPTKGISEIFSEQK